MHIVPSVLDISDGSMATKQERDQTDSNVLPNKTMRRLKLQYDMKVLFKINLHRIFLLCPISNVTMSIYYIFAP